MFFSENNSKNGPQWITFLDKVDGILSGKLLIAFWRGDDPVGVNLNPVFNEPKSFDLVLWAQGTAALSYLEDGMLTQPEFWLRLIDSFNDLFIGFALWFN